MNPKEKARELVNEFSRLFVPINFGLNRKHYAKQCAIIAVDEILNEENDFIQTKWHNNYWQEVKQEIEKL